MYVKYILMKTLILSCSLGFSLFVLMESALFYYCILIIKQNFSERPAINAVGSKENIGRF